MTLGPARLPARPKPLLHVPPDKVIAIARQLKIVHHESGTLEYWPVNEEQEQLFKDLWLYRQVYVLKVRQIGASTAVCLDDLLWAAVNDTAGHRVRCGIVVDTDAKARERLHVCYDFAKQLGISCRLEVGANTIRFPNGSEIIGMTAGGKRAGASMTFQRFHFTELPFWRDPNASYTSLMQALVLGGRVVIETTMGIDDPTAKDLWVMPNDYLKRFFSFEEHMEYRMPLDRSILDEDMESYLRSEGFTNLEAMTYWVWLMLNRCAGDLVRCFREYPQRPEHSWMFAEGRWVHKTPRVMQPIEEPLCSYTSDRVRMQIYRKPSDGTGQYIIGVDTSGGLGLDSSAVAVVDAETQQVMATMCDSDVKIDDLVQVAQELREMYSSGYQDRAGRWRNHEPDIIVEDNGIGRATVQAAVKAGVSVIAKNTSKASRYDGLLIVKRLVETGRMWGPEDLARECDELRVDNGKFVGPKDTCMAIGIALLHLYENRQQYIRDTGGLPEGHVDMMQVLEEYMRKAQIAKSFRF